MLQQTQNQRDTLEKHRRNAESNKLKNCFIRLWRSCEGRGWSLLPVQVRVAVGAKTKSKDAPLPEETQAKAWEVFSCDQPRTSNG